MFGMNDGHFLRTGRAAVDWRCAAQGNQLVPPSRPDKVDQHRTQIGSRSGPIGEAIGAAENPNEGVVDQILGHNRIEDQEAAEPKQRRRVVRVELGQRGSTSNVWFDLFDDGLRIGAHTVYNACEGRVLTVSCQILVCCPPPGGVGEVGGVTAWPGARGSTRQSGSGRRLFTPAAAAGSDYPIDKARGARGMTAEIEWFGIAEGSCTDEPGARNVCSSEALSFTVISNYSHLSIKGDVAVAAQSAYSWQGRQVFGCEQATRSFGRIPRHGSGRARRTLGPRVTRRDDLRLR